MPKKNSALHQAKDQMSWPSLWAQKICLNWEWKWKKTKVMQICKYIPYTLNIRNLLRYVLPSMKETG
jgi:hypothetical protein